MVLSRLLEPKDFGLLGMVTAFTGVLSLFRDFGLSAATVQSSAVSEEQASTLFWINILAGGLLTGVAIALAPFVSIFYHEPRLLTVTAFVALGFLFNGAGVQHSALLQREMRFTTLAVIDVVSLVVGTAVAIMGAKAGYGYWALVAMTVALPLVTSVGLWLSSAWIPGKPRRGTGIRSMMCFGGTVTLNSLTMYLASNFEKVLLGRFWGAEALGIYGRAYQLIRIPSDNLNSAVGDVAFSALSRLQDDPGRLKRYFLKGYSLILALTLPVTIACALFADDLVFVLLGPKWKGAVAIFRLLSPTILVFAIANPLGWLMNSIGLVGRGLKMALVVAPLMIASYLIGLPYGPRGVAFAYSAIVTLWVIPIVAWSVHRTVISFWDICLTVSRPLSSALMGAALALGVRIFLVQKMSPLPRLLVENMTLFGVYAALLLFVGPQSTFYLNFVRQLVRQTSDEESRGELVSI